MLVKMLSWNVNGLRAISKKPEWSWFADTDADIVGLQETKASPEQLTDSQVHPQGWHSCWASSTIKKGYSGVAVFSKQKVLTSHVELPDVAFQGEGRLVHMEFPWFHFFCVYFPNGGSEVLDEHGKKTGSFLRVPYKMGFFDAFLAHAEILRAQKPIVVCGDFNIAHKAIDLARPKQNEKNTGFLPEERAWMDAFTRAGYVDTFRAHNGDVDASYTWWSYKAGARAKNVGWRLDYFFVSEELRPAIRDAWIESHVFGSDHCPVGLILEVN